MPEDFTDEFADADLKDVRRSRRLGKVAAALAKSPAASISAASGGWAETMAAFRLLHCEEFAPGALIAPHTSATVERCAGQACVVVSQDTTEFDFTHMKATQGLGPLNDEHRRGFFMHSQYAVSEQGLPLGLLDATIVLRDNATFRSTASRKQRPIADKESQRWLDGYQKAAELARELPDCEVVSISDREGDIFELYQAWRLAAGGPRAGWIIRANQDRALLGVVEGEPAKLFAALEAATVLGGIEFEMRARKGTKKVKGSTVATFRSARTVRQVVRAMKITPRPPHRKGMKLKEVSFWAILAEETDPPAGEDPIRWLLLTSKEVTTLEEARRVLNLYLRRWDIEVFHRVLKTGCRVERIQLKTGQAVINALMIYAVIAWRILYLTHLGRQCPDLPCGCVFEEAEWKSACAVVKRKQDAGEPSLSEFIGIVGKLGGHLGRKSDGAPGPQSIWQGLARVRDFACAWHAFHGE
jgi:Transposase Tn5 dimerisation domain/Transposase DNA-binding